MRRLFLALAMLLAACTEAAPPTTPAPSTTPPTTTSSTTTTVPATTTSSPATTTTSPPETEQAIADPFTTLPRPDEELPHNLGLHAFGDSGLVYAGAVSPTPRDHPNEPALWHWDGVDWDRTLVADITDPSEYGFYPEITSLVFWNGRYLAFLMGDMAAQQGEASYLTSTDGIAWEIERIRPQLRGAGSLPGIFPTPESPPFPGPAGIAGAITTADEVIAVGWVRTTDGSSGVVWRSHDGESWILTPLPNAAWDYEWANTVAVGESGWLVAGTGPVHSNSLLWFSPDGEEWTPIHEGFGDENWWSFSALASGDDGLVVIATDFGDFQSRLFRSTDGMAWTDVGPVDIEGPINRRDALSSDGEVMTLLRRGDDAIVMETSRDGLEWTPLTEFPHQFAEEPEYDILYRMQLVGDTAMVTRTDDPWGDSTIGVWFDAPVMDVILVEPDDILNVRDGVMAEIIGDLPPAETSIVTTGRTDGAAGSLWMEILHNGRLGWVNSLYLAEPLENLAAHDPMALVEEFAERVLRDGGSIGPFVGPKGLSVSYWEPARRWHGGNEPMADSTVYIWGCPECPPDPGPSHHATFADWIASGFLKAWDRDGRTVALGEPGSPSELEAQHPRVQYKNLPYIAIHDPGGDEYQDWKTWFIYFDRVGGEPVIAAIAADMWIP